MHCIKVECTKTVRNVWDVIIHTLENLEISGLGSVAGIKHLPADSGRNSFMLACEICLKCIVFSCDDIEYTL